MTKKVKDIENNSIHKRYFKDIGAVLERGAYADFYKTMERQTETQGKLRRRAQQQQLAGNEVE